MKTKTENKTHTPTFLKRNHILSANDKGSDFEGEWVVIPREDFDFAIASHAALLEAAKAAQSILGDGRFTPSHYKGVIQKVNAAIDLAEEVRP